MPGILSGAVPPVTSPGGYIAMGGTDEATWYAEECGPAWRGTPGAVEWLTGTATA